MRSRFRAHCHGEIAGCVRLIECELVEKIPFIPTVGMHLQVTPSGRIFTVDRVMWTISAPGTVTVWFREEADPADIQTAESLEAAGWSIER